MDLGLVQVPISIDAHRRRPIYAEFDKDGRHPGQGVQRAGDVSDATLTTQSGDGEGLGHGDQPFGSGAAPQLRKRRLLETTKNEENAIAAPAISGLSRPAAAIGMAATL